MKLNPGMLIIARGYRGITQKGLAKMLRVSQGRISKIEMDVISCPEELLLKISESLDFPIDFFTQNRKIYGLPLSVHGINYKY